MVYQYSEMLLTGILNPCFGTDMSSTAFIEPKTVMEFIGDLLNKELTRSLTDADRMKVLISSFALSSSLPQ